MAVGSIRGDEGKTQRIPESQRLNKEQQAPKSKEAQGQDAVVIKFMQDKPAPAKKQVGGAVSGREFMQDYKDPQKVGDQAEKAGFMQDNKPPKAQAEFMQDTQKKPAAYDRPDESGTTGPGSRLADLKL